jgi:hypothetical protein
VSARRISPQDPQSLFLSSHWQRHAQYALPSPWQPHASSRRFRRATKVTGAPVWKHIGFLLPATPGHRSAAEVIDAYPHERLQHGIAPALCSAIVIASPRPTFAPMNRIGDEGRLNHETTLQGFKDQFVGGSTLTCLSRQCPMEKACGVWGGVGHAYLCCKRNSACSHGKFSTC